MSRSTATGLVQQIIEGTGQLYSLPAVAAELLRLTGEPRIDPRRVKECLQRDPALTARILKVVNSSLFGLSRPVTDLNQALGILGTRPLRMLVLGFSLPKALFAGLQAEVLSRYWRHSLNKAVAARELAERLWQIPGDEAFTAGLIQDIGVLALCQQVGPSYVQFLDHVQTHGGNLIDRELETLGFDHAVLTARLLGHWGLPAALCGALAVPPDERCVAALEPAERTLPQILHLAELLARLIEQPYGPALQELLAVGGRYCGLTYERLRPISVVLQTKVEELAEVLDLTLPGDDSYVDLLVAAHSRLAEITLAEAIPQAPRGPEEDLLALTAQLQAEIADLRSSQASGVRKLPGKFDRQFDAPADSPGSQALLGNARWRSSASLDLAERRNPEIPDVLSPVEQSSAVAKRIADPVLLGRLSAAINRCRQARCGLTLALVEIDGCGDLALALGPGGLADLLHHLRVALGDWSSQRGPAVLVGDGLFALVFENSSRSEALAAIRQVLGQIKTFPAGLAHEELTASAGLATLSLPPKNFPPHQLLDAAERCLTGAKLSGGNSLKSIEF